MWFSYEQRIKRAKKRVLNQFLIRELIYFDGRHQYEVVEKRGRSERKVTPLKRFDSEEEATNFVRKLRTEQCVCIFPRGTLCEDSFEQTEDVEGT